MCEILCSAGAEASARLHKEDSIDFTFLAYQPQLTICLGGIQGFQNESLQMGHQLVHCNIGFASAFDDLHDATWSRTSGPHWMEEIEILDCRDALLFSIWTGGPDGSWHLLGEALLSTTTYHPHGFNGELPLQLSGKNLGVYIRLKVKMDGHDYPDECALGDTVVSRAISRCWEQLPAIMI